MWKKTYAPDTTGLAVGHLQIGRRFLTRLSYRRVIQMGRLSFGITGRVEFRLFAASRQEGVSDADTRKGT